MKFKMILALVSDDKTETVTEAGRDAGARGCTVITSARGEGLEPHKTFLGLTLEGQMDVIIFIVEEHMSRRVLEAISAKARLEEEHGSGIAFQIDIEDAMGLRNQIKSIESEIEDQI